MEPTALTVFGFARRHNRDDVRRRIFHPEHGSRRIGPGPDRFNDGLRYVTTPALDILEGPNPQLSSILGDVTMLPVTVTGTVKEGSSGLAGVTVTLQGASGSSTVTASGGNFTFSLVQPGNYTIIASKTGYIQTNTTITVLIPISIMPEQ